MSERVEWKILYEDDRTYTNLDGPWEAAPSDGVMCVIVRSEKVGRKVFNGSDFYFKIGEDSDGRDILAYADDLGPFLRKLGLVKYGRWASDKAMELALIEAQNDEDMPPQSAKDPFFDDPDRNIPSSIKQG